MAAYYRDPYATPGGHVPPVSGYTDPYPPGPQTPGGPEIAPYSSTDRFAQDDYAGQDSSGARDLYPPKRGKEGEKGSFEGGARAVTRGSIAAQMAAEGQIPKKEGLRMWRSDEHAGALMKGGKGRCCGRVCGCSIILVLIILVSIIASFFLWVKPPDVTFNGIEPPRTGSEVDVQTNGFLLNFGLNIGVINPNFFGADFKRIEATAFYSTAPTIEFGGGSLDSFEIKKSSNTTIHFPFTINYTTTIDPNLAILKDIATKCGFLGTTAAQDLKVNYTIRLSLKIFAITVNPSFSSSASFPCPLSESDISSLIGSGGLGALSGRSLDRRSLDAVMSKVLERGWEQIAADLGGGMRMLY